MTLTISDAELDYHHSVTRNCETSCSVYSTFSAFNGHHGLSVSNSQLFLYPHKYMTPPSETMTNRSETNLTNTRFLTHRHSQHQPPFPTNLDPRIFLETKLFIRKRTISRRFRPITLVIIPALPVLTNPLRFLPRAAICRPHDIRIGLPF